MKQILTTFLLMWVITFNAQSQTLVSMTPSTGTVGTTVNVTITGNRTNFTSSTTFVLSLGSSIINLSNVVAMSSTSATAKVVIPSNAASGSYTLLAVAGLGLPLQLANAFTVTGGVPVASLVSIAPNSGNQGQSLLVTITGANTMFTQSSNTTVALTSLGGGGTPIVSPTALAQNNTTLRTLISIPGDATPGAYALVVNTSNDGTLILPNAFTVNGTNTGTPKITAVSPATARRGQTLNVTITGANTNFAQASDLTVSLFNSGSPLTANFAFANSNTSIIANFSIPANQTLGLHDVYVFSMAGGLLTLPASFTVTAASGGNTPSLVSVSPPYGNKGQTLDISITGVNTRFSQGSNVIAIYTPDQTDGVEATAVTVISDTEVKATFTIPSTWANGLFNVGVMSDVDGLLELPLAFSVVTTGVREYQGEKHPLTLYPNPATNVLLFETPGKVKVVEVIDIAGKSTQVELEDMEESGLGVYKFDLERVKLTKGIYFLRVETDQGSFYQKFMKN